MNFKYRPDIDGLRAIAVLLVIFYHSGFNYISGGFIGVDVFFVISGYLITSIIYKDIKFNKFQLKNFYIKRVKRILPSFYVVIFTTLFFGYFLLLPNDFVVLTKSFLASAFFITNMFFWKVTGGYFSSNTGEIPLLHIWSLSVEEQFYFIWPLLLLIFIKSRLKTFILPILVVTIISTFMISEWAAINKPNAAYYFLPTRAGELLIGVFLAIYLSSTRKLKPLIAELVSITGLSLIISSALFLTELSTFPGINSLYPCIGAALLILSGKDNDTFISKSLSSKPLVFIGLISYPMYLWHWPIIAYLDYLNYEFTYTVKFTIISTTVVLATITLIFIEDKIRTVNFSSKTIFQSFFVLPSFIVVFISIVIIGNNGFENRLIENQKYNSVTNALVMPTVSRGWCYQTEPNDNQNSSHHCFLGNIKSDNRAIFIGDSHAGHYQELVSTLGKKLNLKINTFITSNCFPSLRTSTSANLGGNPSLCKNFRNEIKEMIFNKKIQTIFIAAKWDANIQWLEETEEALSLFSNQAMSVIVLPQLPSYINNPPQDYLRESVLGMYNTDYNNELDDLYIFANKKVKDLTLPYNNIMFIDLMAFIGKDKELPLLSSDGLPFYFDSNHLNVLGSAMLVNRFFKNPESNNLVKFITENTD